MHVVDRDRHLPDRGQLLDDEVVSLLAAHRQGGLLVAEMITRARKCPTFCPTRVCWLIFFSRNRLILNGSGGWDRTNDLVINSHPLCR